MTQVADLGEFSLIARLTASLPTPPDVIAGVGDDAAILDIQGAMLVATCDAQVQDTHFRLERAAPQDIGRKALAVNISDCAAMGAHPRFALISLLLPPTLEVAILDGIYDGMRQEAARFGVAIIGGNIARLAERLVLDITLLGLADERRVLRRQGARPGDAIFVTGTLGLAGAGLLAQEDPALSIPLEVRQTALQAQQRPEPRVADGLWLAAHGATAAIDISDGFLADLGHLCEASGVQAEIAVESLPIAHATRTIAQAVGIDPVELALSAGEDYELIFTVPARAASDLARHLAEATGTTATQIGICAEGAPRVTIRGYTRSANAPTGWDHIRGPMARN